MGWFSTGFDSVLGPFHPGNWSVNVFSLMTGSSLTFEFSLLWLELLESGKLLYRALTENVDIFGREDDLLRPVSLNGKSKPTSL